MKTATSLLLLLFSPAALATDLNINVKSGGSNLVKVSPGATVNYEIVGELSDATSQGLAMFSLDLSFPRGALFPLSAPGSGPMLNFVSPLGLNNPAGYGGTMVGQTLRQVGGAQNTINNIFAPFPSGSVQTGIALQGSPETLATGSLTAPSAYGSYNLDVANLFANAIDPAATGFPFWEVDAAGSGTVTTLTVEVVSLSADKDTISISGAPETQTMTLDAGAANAGRVYWLLGSVSGTSPGIPLFVGVLPLNFDAYMNFTIIAPNTPLLSNSLNYLDGQGESTATFNLPGGLSPSLAGVTIHHAYVLLFPLDFISNAVSVTLVP